jgi:hypothetical protein
VNTLKSPGVFIVSGLGGCFAGSIHLPFISTLLIPIDSDCLDAYPKTAPPPLPTDLAVRREWRRSILTLGGQRNGTHEEGQSR